MLGSFMSSVQWCRREGGGDINTLKVLVATDCHLGYMEKDEIRRFDSFQAFEEICSLADQNKVCRNDTSAITTCFPGSCELMDCLCFIRNWIPGRFYTSWWWFIPWEQAVTLNPGENYWDPAALLPKWPTSEVPGCQWPDNQFPKQVSTWMLLLDQYFDSQFMQVQDNFTIKLLWRSWSLFLKDLVDHFFLRFICLIYDLWGLLERCVDMHMCLSHFVTRNFLLYFQIWTSKLWRPKFQCWPACFHYPWKSWWPSWSGMTLFCYPLIWTFFFVPSKLCVFLLKLCVWWDVSFLWNSYASCFLL